MRFFKRNIVDFTDEDLLARYKETRDTEYFGQLYDRYLPLIYGLCLKYLKNVSLAEDAVMQLFEDLLFKVPEYEIKTFRTWIYTVAKNHCFQLLRKKESEVVVDFNTFFMESEDVLHLLDEDETPDNSVALKHCLEKLPEPQRISISKFFMEEMSYADIVDATGYSLKGVKSYIQNAKRNLKICMEKQLVDE